MRPKKTLMVAIVILLYTASFASGGLTLAVNGLDVSGAIEVRPDTVIVIAVAGQTNDLKQNYSVTCDAGVKLEPAPEPNEPIESPTQGRYLLTFLKVKNCLCQL
jgi:hypothetical protein